MAGKAVEGAASGGVVAIDEADGVGGIVMIFGILIKIIDPLIEARFEGQR